MCYHVAPSGAGGKEEGGVGYEIGRRVGKVERGCGVETGGELNSSSKPHERDREPESEPRRSCDADRGERWEFGCAVCWSEWALAG